MQRLYETKLTEMAQEREAARTTHHVKALQKETHTEEPKDKCDGVENLRQEVVKMAQEKNICSESSKKNRNKIERVSVECKRAQSK